jgi:hypothetical protein
VASTAIPETSAAVTNDAGLPAHPAGGHVKMPPGAVK